MHFLSWKDDFRIHLYTKYSLFLKIKIPFFFWCIMQFFMLMMDVLLSKVFLFLTHTFIHPYCVFCFWLQCSSFFWWYFHPLTIQQSPLKCIYPEKTCNFCFVILLMSFCSFCLFYFVLSHFRQLQQKILIIISRVIVVLYIMCM